MAPVIRGKKGEHLGIYEELRKSGYVRVKVNGIVYPIEEFPSLEKNKKHDISAVIDRLVIKKGDEIIVSQLEHHSNIVPWQMLCEKTGAKMKVIGNYDYPRMWQILPRKILLKINKNFTFHVILSYFLRWHDLWKILIKLIRYEIKY